jgi:glutamyl/glutaminyl-tRNA synthetase
MVPAHLPPPGGRTRLAPTPSGFLHAGNAINFLITHRLARATGARLRLRIDDLDAERVRPAYVEDVFQSLHWLGISWEDGPTSPEAHAAQFSQHLRSPRYHALIARLRAAGHLYACTCSRSRLAQAGCDCRKAGHPFDAPDTAWRLHVPAGTTITVPVSGGAPVAVDLVEAMGDPVLRQRNGRPAYQIASLADDLDHGTTFIVRGADLLPSTACQLYLAELLGEAAFGRVRFLHHALELGPDGGKLAKSAGSTSLQSMREAGLGPEALWERAETMLRSLTS